MASRDEAAAAKAEDDRQELLEALMWLLSSKVSRAISEVNRIKKDMLSSTGLDTEDMECEAEYLEASLLQVKNTASDLKAIVRPSDNLWGQAKEAVHRADKEVTSMVMKLREIKQAQVAVPFGSGASVSDAGCSGQGATQVAVPFSYGASVSDAGRSGQGATSGTNSSSYIVRCGGGGARTSSNSDIVRGGGGRSRSSFKKNYNSSKICTSKSQFGSTVSGTMQNSIAAAACSQGSGGSISGAVVEVQVVDVTRCIWTPFPRTKKVSKTFFKPGNKMFPPGQKATKNLSGKVEIFTSLPHNSVPQKVAATAGKLRLGKGKFGYGHLIGGTVAHKRDQANATTSMATISKLRWGYGAPMSFPKKEPMGTEAPRSCASCRSCKCAYSEEPLSQDVVSEGAVAVMETVAIVEKPSMEHKRTFTKKWRVCAKVCLFISRLKMTTKTVEVAVKDGQEVKSGPPSGFLQVAEDNLVEEAQKDLITSGPPPGLLQMTEDSLQEAAVKPLANENGQESLKPLADENGQEAVKPVAIKNGQEVTSITSPGCQQVTENNLKEEALVDLDIKKLSNFIPFCKKVMDLLEGEIPLWAVGGHIMAKMKFPILDHSSPKPSCSCKKLTHGMVARTAWC